MIQTLKETIASTKLVNGKFLLIKEMAGLSTDTKPKDCATGSLFTEVNTGDTYIFDSSGSGTWYLFPPEEPSVET